MFGSAVFYLLAAAVGYLILERASTQKKNLKTIGQIVGILIITLSFLSFACKVYWVSKWKTGIYGKGGAACPICLKKAAK